MEIRAEYENELQRMDGMEETEINQEKVTTKYLKDHRKKLSIIIAIVLGIILIAISISKYNAEKNIETYRQNYNLASYSMLTYGEMAMQTGLNTSRIWRNLGAMMPVESLKSYLEHESYQAIMSLINDGNDLVRSLMKELKNPPKDYKEAHAEMKKMYHAYKELTQIAMNPSGALMEYMTEFNKTTEDFKDCAEVVSLYLE